MPSTSTAQPPQPVPHLVTGGGPLNGQTLTITPGGGLIVCTSVGAAAVQLHVPAAAIVGWVEYAYQSDLNGNLALVTTTVIPPSITTV